MPAIATLVGKANWWPSKPKEQPRQRAIAAATPAVADSPAETADDGLPHPGNGGDAPDTPAAQALPAEATT